MPFTVSAVVKNVDLLIEAILEKGLERFILNNFHDDIKKFYSSFSRRIFLCNVVQLLQIIWDFGRL